MNRCVEKNLVAWKSRENRKPLVVRGARQVGKTWLVETFGKKHFATMLTVNLEKMDDLHPLFDQMDAKRIVQELSLYFNQPIISGQTLLFFDEIQACPKAIACLRYFYEEMPGLHIIAAGSLLDLTLRESKLSVPVGRIEYLYLNPFTFEEFVVAMQEDMLVRYLREYRLGEEFALAAQSRLQNLFRLYYFIGGMPAVIAAYVKKHDLLAAQMELSSIITTLQDDFAKYGSREQQRNMRQILKFISRNLGRKVRYVNINRDVRSSALRTAIDLLEASRIIKLVKHSSGNGVPIGAEASDNHFKAILLDIGLCNNLCGLSLPRADELLTVHEGGLAEQFIGQELRSQGPVFEDQPLYYWHREKQNANAEVDYLLAFEDQVIPVEVRAGTSGSLKSAKLFLVEKQRRMAVRFNMDQPSVGGFTAAVTESERIHKVNYTLLSLPLYLVGQLQRMIRAACEIACDV